MIDKTKRIHSLDSLRAIMMLLGLVLHSGVTYGVIDYGEGWIMKDDKTSLINDFIAVFIHSFRMQVFFLVAGFFGAMLFYEKQPLNMIKNRLTRIVYPFLVFLFILSPIVLYVFKNSKLTIKPSERQELLFAKFSDLSFLIPEQTAHLWFLYYLILITLFSVLLAFVFRSIPRVSQMIKNAFEWVMSRSLARLIVFPIITALLLKSMGVTLLDTGIWLKPDYKVFSYYLMFYLVGWLLYKSKHLLNSFKKWDYLSTILGFLMYVTSFLGAKVLTTDMTLILNATMVWFFAFGMTGLFIRYCSKYSAKMRYVSDSSYWVYLVHLPLTIFIPSLIVDWQVHAVLKFLTVCITTGVICFVSYHFLVRNTFIGEFLNGRRYSRKLSDIN